MSHPGSSTTMFYAIWTKPREAGKNYYFLNEQGPREQAVSNNVKKMTTRTHAKTAMSVAGL